MLKNFMHYLFARSGERSTWLGLVSLATALGLLLSTAQQEAIIVAGTALGGLLAAFLPDKK